MCQRAVRATPQVIARVMYVFRKEGKVMRTRKIRVKMSHAPAPVEITATFVNPGEWFKKRWIVGVGAGFDCIWYVVEGDYEGDVLDNLVDSQWGHIVKTECDHDNTDDCILAGNFGEHVDFDDIRVLERV